MIHNDAPQLAGGCVTERPSFMNFAQDEARSCHGVYSSILVMKNGMVWGKTSRDLPRVRVSGRTFDSSSAVHCPSFQTTCSTGGGSTKMPTCPRQTSKMQPFTLPAC